MATQDETLFKLRKWEAEIKAKNAEKRAAEAVKDVKAVVEHVEERLKDGVQVEDVTATVQEVEAVTTKWCWCWTKQPVTSTPGPAATS